MTEVSVQDVQLFHKGENANVWVSGTLLNGWVGGQFVAYTAPPANAMPLTKWVVASDGTAYAGFLLRADEHAPLNEYRFTAMQPSKTQVALMIPAGGSFLFRYYEKFAFPNRDSGVPLVYSYTQTLSLSERGFLTTTADAVAAGIATPQVLGVVWAIPETRNQFRLGVDLRT